MKKRKITVAVLAIIIVLMLFPPLDVLAQNETKTVRVGFYYSEGYHVMDEEGNKSGFVYDFLQQMLLYTNWQYEYVGYDKGWAEIQTMLENGEIDLVASAIKTEARMEIFDYCDRPIADSAASLMVKAGSESPYMAGDYENYDGMRIGLLSTASQIASLENFAAEKGFTYEPVYYADSYELAAALEQSAEVDAIVTSNMRIIPNSRVLDLFDSKDVYIIVKKGNTELMKEINYALEELNTHRPGLSEELFRKYYSSDTGEEIFFTPDERVFIEECQQNGTVFKAAINPDIAPYSYFKDGAPAGIACDIAAEIVSRTGLAVEIVETDRVADYRALQTDDTIALWLTSRFDYNYAEQRGVKLIDPYYQTDVSRLTRKDYEGAITTVAVVETGNIADNFPVYGEEDTEVRYYSSVDECVEAVLARECDAAYLYTRTAQQAVYNDVTNRLTSVIMPRFSTSFSIGVRQTEDTRLASVLAKSAASLSEEDISAAVLKYTNYSVREPSVIGYLYNRPVAFVASVAFLFVVLLIAVLGIAAQKRRQAEQEKNILLSQQNTELEQMVEKLSQTQEELRQAVDAAERANAAKGQFTSRMSHEIRTPLNAVMGYMTIANDCAGDPEKLSDSLTKAQIAARHLLAIINDVLDMSSIESGRIKIARQRFDVKGLISSLTVMFYAQAREKQLDFKVDLRGLTTEQLVGDDMRLNQILMNLLSNAVKFTPAGGSVTLVITQEHSGNDKILMKFEVSDTGIGMSSEFMERLFTAYEQQDADIAKAYGGTGLGLSIAQNLVMIMGGSLEVRSNEGQGSTFTVILPFDYEAEGGDRSAYDFSEIHALIVDDEPETAEHMSMLLERCGVRNDTFTRGEAALEAIRRARAAGDEYNLCLMDWKMGDPNGLATARRIREEQPEGMPIVVSAYDFSDIGGEARMAGVDRLIAKPLFQSELFDLLVSVYSKQNPEWYASSAPQDFSGNRVLLVEDNEMNLEIATEILLAQGMAVDQARNGQEAMEIFTNAPAGTYQAILMDIQMPVMDGHEATRAIRAGGHPEAQTIPILAMTANAFADDVTSALDSGMNDHIAKPIDIGQLFAMLAKYMTA